VHVAERSELGVTPERAVVEGDLGVKGQHAPIRGHHQRVDLGERAIFSEIQRKEISDEGHARLHRLAREAETEREPACLEIAETERGMGPLAKNLRGHRGRDFLDLHPARRGCHHHMRRTPAIERDR